jgi:hypothetical protein
MGREAKDRLPRFCSGGRLKLGDSGGLEGACGGLCVVHLERPFGAASRTRP